MSNNKLETFQQSRFNLSELCKLREQTKENKVDLESTDFDITLQIQILFLTLFQGRYADAEQRLKEIHATTESCKVNCGKIQYILDTVSPKTY